MEEPEKSVKFAVAQLIAVLARHEFRQAVGWPELIAFLQAGLSSQVTLFALMAVPVYNVYLPCFSQIL